MTRFRSDEQRKAIFANLFKDPDKKSAVRRFGQTKNLNVERKKGKNIIKSKRTTKNVTRIEGGLKNYSKAMGLSIGLGLLFESESYTRSDMDTYKENKRTRKMSEEELKPLRNELKSRIIMDTEVGEGREKIFNQMDAKLKEIKVGMTYSQLEKVLEDFIVMEDKVFSHDPDCNPTELMHNAGIKIQPIKSVKNSESKIRMKGLSASVPPKGRESESIIFFDNPIPIELVSTTDPYTNLKSGAKGKAIGWNKSPDEWVLMIDWEKGGNMGLVHGVDKWKQIKTVKKSEFQGRTMFGPPRFRKYSDIVTIKSVPDARIAATTLKNEYKDAKTRSKKTRVKRVTNLTVNRLGASLKKKDLKPETRKRLEKTRDIYKRALVQMKEPGLRTDISPISGRKLEKAKPLQIRKRITSTRRKISRTSAKISKVRKDLKDVRHGLRVAKTKRQAEKVKRKSAEIKRELRQLEELQKEREVLAEEERKLKKLKSTVHRPRFKLPGLPKLRRNRS